MKHTLLFFTAILFLCIQSHAQNVAINNDGSEPDPSAALDVKATDKGVLIPRVDFNNLPVSPPTGLLVYVTTNGPDGDNAFYYFDGSQWQKLSGAVGLENFTESNFTYDSKTGVKLTPDNAAATVDFVLQPKGYGAILAQQPDGTITGGNKRGNWAVDLQMTRNNASQVASGIRSVIIGGANNTASGELSTAMGLSNIASGPVTRAIGIANTASGVFSTAIGGNNVANGESSLAMGYSSNASGNYSTAIGNSSDATANSSFAAGKDALASGDIAVAIGNGPTASGYASLAMGDYTTASGRISTAFGNRTTAPSANETVFGKYNSDYTPSSTTDWILTDRLFVVGNGASDVTKSNALTIFKNANTTIGGSLTFNANGTNTSLTFPTGRGTSGQVLTSDGSGGTFWSYITSSQWITSGANISYNGGRVGIGTTSPLALLDVGNSVSNRKIILFSSADNDHEFTGLGINFDAFRLQLANTTGNFKFYGATSATTSTELFRIQGDGQIMIPAMSTAGVLHNSSTGLVSSSIGTSGQVLSTNGSGGLSWTTPYSGLTNFTETNFTYDSRTGVKFTPNNTAANVDFVIQPKGFGGIMAQQADGTTTGGNKRGLISVDLQLSRSTATQVASGNYSVIIGGWANTASGSHSIAMGSETTASGNNSISMGGATLASGDNSTAIGYATIASGDYSTAMGGATNASGTSSLAMGSSSDAIASFSVAIGKDALASDQYAVAMGNNPTASGYASLALGDYTTASGRISTAMGNRTIAPSAYETVFGRYNSDYTPSSTTDWIVTDRLFVVGNGASDVTKSNALTILKNANTTIGGSLTFNANGTNTSLTFPTSRGTSGQVLTSDGSGGTSWATSTESQWITSGSNIYFNSGNIGIGTSNPGSRLTLGNNVGDNFDAWTDYQLLLFTAPLPQNSFGIGIKASTLAFNSDSDFDFDQDGSTVMTIQSGKVGIGTSDPTQKLEVNGNVFIPAGSSYWIGNAGDAGNRLRLHQTGSNAYIDWGEETLFFRSGVGAATNKVVFTGDGKVGIGTTTPRAGLDLGLGISNRKLILYTTADNDHQFTGLGVNVDAMRYQIGNTSGNHKFYAATSATTSTELFRIQGNGQIVIPALTTQGIVQNSASGLLSSTKGTANQVLKMNATGTSTEWGSAVLGVTGTAPIVSSGGINPAISINPATTSSAGSMSAADKTKLDGVVSSQWITSGSGIYYNAGNVGIGTSSPTQKLNVNGEVLLPAGKSYWIGSTDDAGDRLRLHHNGTNAYIDWGQNDLHFRFGDATTAVSDKVVLKADGNVGIGTSNPTSKVQVNGDLATQNGKVRRDFITYSNPGTALENIPCHIKTNIQRGSGIGYRFLVEGYNYHEGKPINSEACGSSIYDGSGPYKSSTIDHAGGANLQLYYSSDDYLVLVLIFDTGSTGVGFSVSAWFVNSFGSGFDVSAEVFQQTVGL